MTIANTEQLRLQVQRVVQAQAVSLLPAALFLSVLPLTATEPSWVINLAHVATGSIQKFSTATEMKRAARPEELSPADVFPALPVCASYITGIVLPVTSSVGV